MRFENDMGVKQIVMYLRNLKIFCPIGKTWYTLEAKINFIPNKTIPDYIEVQNYLNTEIVNQSLTIESATSKIQNYLSSEYNPVSVKVVANVKDAAHFEVDVVCY